MGWEVIFRSSNFFLWQQLMKIITVPNSNDTKLQQKKVSGNGICIYPKTWASWHWYISRWHLWWHWYIQLPKVHRGFTQGGLVGRRWNIYQVLDLSASTKTFLQKNIFCYLSVAEVVLTCSAVEIALSSVSCMWVVSCGWVFSVGGLCWDAYIALNCE